MYEKGRDEINSNFALSLRFKQKASERGSIPTIIELAHFYQACHGQIQQNASLVFSYYLQAARLGHEDALAPLERLGQDAKINEQLVLAELYRSGIFRNEKKAQYWQCKAEEIMQFDFYG